MLPVGFAVIRLDVTVDDGVRIDFFPLRRRKIAFADIVAVEAARGGAPTGGQPPA